MGAARPQTKRQQILSAASRLFMGHGYGAVSMEAIAREAGVSKATLYAHFTGKERLFAAMIAEKMDRHAAGLTAVAGRRQDIRAELLAAAREHLALLLSPEAVGIYRTVIAELPRFPELGRVFFESGAGVKLDLVAEFLRRAAARGVLAVDEPHMAAGEFLAMVGAFLHLRAMLGLGAAIGASEREAVAGHAVDTFLRAYRP